MKNIGYKLTLLIFFISLLSGFYMRLPLMDNLIRSFVIYLIFSVMYLLVMLVMNQLSLESLKNRPETPKKSRKEELNKATPNIAK